MIAVKAPSLGRAGGLVRRQPGGTACRSIFATVFGSMPKRRAASRWLSPSTWQAWRTRAYSSTAFILTLPAVRTGRKIRRRLFTPPPRPDTPAASVRDFLSAAYRFSRRVLAWRLSIPMEAAFCVEALEEALARHGRPEIFNTDQGSQFTSEAFTGVLTRNGIAISMDGKGAWRDNVFVERLWRSVKYEEVYLRAYDTVAEARASIGRYLSFYNARRPHSSLDRQTPDRAYFTRLPQIAAA